MNIKASYSMPDSFQRRFATLYEKYKGMALRPEEAKPAFIINTPVDLPPWEERLANPFVMLKSQLDGLKNHMELEDDCVPGVRVDFGTAIIASAFGCELFIPPNNLPCAKTHVLTDMKNVRALEKPGPNAGWSGKLRQFTEYFLQNLPVGYHIQLPDIQSPFNNAHLIRGNDIFLDFHDHPDELGFLLDFITDYMIEYTREQRSYITDDAEWFFDWKSLWKGGARISNCTTHLISPETYREFVLERDIRFLQAVGGGRIHYCGSYPKVIESFVGIPAVTGFDYDSQYHSLWDICEMAPGNVVVSAWTGQDSPMVKKLLSGDWPQKRNFILMVDAPDMASGEKILGLLRDGSQAHYAKTGV
ncbi:MAG: uroporphyrinogen decarboxylase family protein [Clostridia bacterium]